MEPLLLLAAEWWWVAPAGAGVGTLGAIGVRRRQRSGRLLELTAARQDVREAHREVARTRAHLKVAQAELLRARAEQPAASAFGAGSEAKRRVQLADRAAKAAVADLRVRRASVQAARATMPPTGAPIEAMPLARLRSEHDALTARWIAYETDPALAIDVPAMSDASSPALQAFLRAQQEATRLRPADRSVRMSPQEFAAYRDAVREATRAFEAAERDALGRAGRGEPAGERSDWGALAQGLLDTAQQALERSAQVWERAERDRRRRRRED
ncbi:hypothetical protein [Agrococcus baldri]|uniref:Uncharacterized protein n=1 Tax=Agrococcus baldri TaxID=153730 RepID=A0AA87RDE1_9MICO|nr:hypothetical protein [Agrococcus baldri]GEK80721.1 hypothetical protein ABA31_20720 [Agrococcus baldri]